jgi:hypothetical protein
MLNVVLWALLTGGVTGGVWMAILLLRRQRELVDDHAELSADVQRRLDDLNAVNTRLAEVEDRLDFAERLLSQRVDVRLPPAK